MNESYEIAKNNVRMVGKGVLNSCSLISEGGLGKSWMVREELERLGEQFLFIGGHLSTSKLYETLYQNNGKVIVFDDCSSVIKSEESLEILKNALQSNGKRELWYKSKGAGVNAPECFEFVGRIILCFNKVSMSDPNVLAVFSRAVPVFIKFSRDEIVKAMYVICDKCDSNVSNSLSCSEKRLVTDWIVECTDRTQVLSFRSQFNAFKVYEGFKMGVVSDWKSQVKSLFGKKRESWIREMVRDLSVNGKVERDFLLREICIVKDMCSRTAQRRLREFLELGELFANKKKGGWISLEPFSVSKLEVVKE